MLAAIGARRTIASAATSSERRVVVATEPEQHVREVGDRGADRRGDRLDQDVAVADVGQLVGEDAAQLVLGEEFGDPAGHGDGGVLGVAAGRESVRLVLGDHVEAGHRQTGTGRQFTDDLEEARVVGLLDRLGAAHLQRQFVAEEVGAEVDQQGDAEEERRRRRAADDGADRRPAGRKGTPAGSSSAAWRRMSIPWWFSSRVLLLVRSCPPEYGEATGAVTIGGNPPFPPLRPPGPRASGRRLLGFDDDPRRDRASPSPWWSSPPSCSGSGAASRRWRA